VIRDPLPQKHIGSFTAAVFGTALQELLPQDFHAWRDPVPSEDGMPIQNKKMHREHKQLQLFLGIKLVKKEKRYRNKQQQKI
jgi:hypothetical protein